MGTRMIAVEGFQQAIPQSQTKSCKSLPQKRASPSEGWPPVNKKRSKTENVKCVVPGFDILKAVDENCPVEDFCESIQQEEATCSSVDEQAHPTVVSEQCQINKVMKVSIGMTEEQGPTTDNVSSSRLSEKIWHQQDQCPAQNEVFTSMQGQFNLWMMNDKNISVGDFHKEETRVNYEVSLGSLEHVQHETTISNISKSVLQDEAHISVKGKVLKSSFPICNCVESEKENTALPSCQPNIISAVLFGEKFQSIHSKQNQGVENLPVVNEIHCAEFGINVRDGGPGPKEDSSLFNIQCKEPSAESAIVANEPGKILSGTGIDKELLNFILLSSQTGGFFISEDLKPPLSGKFDENSEFEKISEVGKGANGVVDLCSHLQTGKKFIRKQISSTTFRKTEVEIHLNLTHDNIVKLYGFIWRNGNPEIFLENCGASLLQFALSPDTGQLLTDERIMDINRQGLKGLEFLAIHRVLHLDIKPENICIQWIHGNFVVKITDFGSACLPHDQLTLRGCNITVEYASPEVCRKMYLLCCNRPQPPVEGDNSVTTQTDIYSWGMTLIFLYRKHHVMISIVTDGMTSYKDLELDEVKQLRRNVVEMILSKPDMAKQLLIPDVCTVDMKELLSQMLEGQPHKRITPSDALQKIQEMKRSGTRHHRNRTRTSKNGDQFTCTKDIKPNTPEFSNIPDLSELL